MTKASTFLVLGLAGGAILGFLASGSVDGFSMNADPGNGPVDPDQTTHQMDGADHDHGRLQDAGAPLPSLTLHLSPEGNCTFTLQIMVENFRFAPENVNGPHVAGEGHAHIYVDGAKLGRIYAPWYYVSAPQGSKTIDVTLNSNDHATLATGDIPITATASLTGC